MQQRCIQHVHLSNQEEEEQREESYVYVYLGYQYFFSVVRTCIVVVCVQSSIRVGCIIRRADARFIIAVPS